MRIFFLILLGSLCIYAQSGIDVPSIGTIVDSSGAVKPVYGVAGSFWLGPTLGRTDIAPPRRSVLRIPDGFVFATKHQVVLRRRDGREMRFELDGVQSINALGMSYAAIRAGDSLYALRIDPGFENLYLLTGGGP